MKNLKNACAVAMITLISACSSVDYANNQPSLSDFHNKDSVSYQNTQYFKSDLKEGGTLKVFSDYNFEVESAPCTVLGIDYGTAQQNGEWEFDVNNNTYVCKLSGGRDKGRRLFLVGTELECTTGLSWLNGSLLNRKSSCPTR